MTYTSAVISDDTSVHYQIHRKNNNKKKPVLTRELNLVEKAKEFDPETKSKKKIPYSASIYIYIRIAIAYFVSCPDSSLRYKLHLRMRIVEYIRPVESSRKSEGIATRNETKSTVAIRIYIYTRPIADFVSCPDPIPSLLPIDSTSLPTSPKRQQKISLNHL
jgi:hypothetical protein